MSNKPLLTEREIERRILCARISINAKQLDFLGEHKRLPTPEEIKQFAPHERRDIHALEALRRKYYPKMNGIPTSLLVQIFMSKLRP